MSLANETQPHSKKGNFNNKNMAATQRRDKSKKQGEYMLIILFLCYE